MGERLGKEFWAISIRNLNNTELYKENTVKMSILEVA